MDQHFEMVGSGLYLPRRQLSAEDVDRRAGLPPGWTREHTGVLVRYECSPPETLASMACAAMQAALAEARLGWDGVDLLLDASTCRHQPIPCNAAYLQHTLGAVAQGIACFDVQSTCLGFIVALNVANALLGTGGYRHIVVVCAEAPLVGVDWLQPESACLMGDGAAAVVLRRRAPTPTYFYAHQTFAEHVSVCEVRGGAHVLPPFACTPDNEAEFRFHMDGPRLMHVAARQLPPMTEALLREAGLTPDELHVVPHQAAPRALTLMRRLLHCRAERFHNRVARFGNLIAAGVPAVLHQCRAEGIVAPGAPLLLLGTSAGYSQAGLIFRM